MIEKICLKVVDNIKKYFKFYRLNLKMKERYAIYILSK